MSARGRRAGENVRALVPLLLIALFLLAALPAMAGCAPAVPMMAGGRTTPRDRVDLALGGAARVPLGDLAPPADAPPELREPLAAGASSGVAPLLLGRVGLDDAWDLSVLVVGTTLRAELRWDAPLSSIAHLVIGAAPYGGYVDGEARQGASPARVGRVGGVIPVALTLDVSGIYEAWVGARVGGEHVAGDVELAPMRTSLALTTVRAGLVVGLAVGFRSVHALVELAADYEHHHGTLGDTRFERQGIVLTPAFALRFRL